MPLPPSLYDGALYLWVVLADSAVEATSFVSRNTLQTACVEPCIMLASGRERDQQIGTQKDHRQASTVRT